MVDSKLILFDVPVPKGIGKSKGQLALLNNIPKWHWASTDKVKKSYKDMVKEWFLSKPLDNEVYNYAYVKYVLLRHNKRVIDADNLGFVVKWTNDCIKELGWLVDDDKLSYSVSRARLMPDLSETKISVRIRLYNKKEKT